MKMGGNFATLNSAPSRPSAPINHRARVRVLGGGLRRARARTRRCVRGAQRIRGTRTSTPRRRRGLGAVRARGFDSARLAAPCSRWCACRPGSPPFPGRPPAGSVLLSSRKRRLRRGAAGTIEIHNPSVRLPFWSPFCTPAPHSRVVLVAPSSARGFGTGLGAASGGS